jgi:UDP-glucose 4-epimerase
VQTASFGTGAKGLIIVPSFRQAARAWGCVPPAGPQRSVHFLAGPSSRPCDQYEILSSVVADGPAAGALTPKLHPTPASNPTRARIRIGGRVARRYTRRVLQGKRILITGGAGFIGTTLARRLVDENEVVAADNLHRDALSGTPLADHPNFSFEQADVLDLDAMTELARGSTHIVHCAAIAGVDTVLESPVRTMRVNVIGTYNMLEAAIGTLDTLERFIDFSTSEVFGTHAFRVEEGQVSTIGSVGEARWTYAVSKLAGEHMAHAYHDELKLPAVTVHPFNVFGPGQIGGGAIRAFIEAALAGRDLTIHGDGSQIRAWCYVDDMVEGCLAALEVPEAVGQAFNIGNPRATVTIFDLAQRINRLAGGTGEITFQPLHYADVELRIPNVAKAREVLGFEAKVDLDEGLEKTIAWYREKIPASV